MMLRNSNIFVKGRFLDKLDILLNLEIFQEISLERFQFYNKKLPFSIIPKFQVKMVFCKYFKSPLRWGKKKTAFIDFYTFFSFIKFQLVRRMVKIKNLTLSAYLTMSLVRLYQCHSFVSGSLVSITKLFFFHKVIDVALFWRVFFLIVSHIFFI